MEASPELTREQMAEKYGVCPTFLSKIKSGVKKMPLRMQLLIWQEQGVTLNGRPVTEWRDVFKQARIEAGLSQAQLAEKMGYAGKGTVWKMEIGKTKTMPVENFKKLVNILNIKGIDNDQERNPVQNQYGSGEKESGPCKPVLLATGATGTVDGEPLPDTHPSDRVQSRVVASVAGPDGATHQRDGVDEVHGVEEVCPDTRDQ